MSHYSKMFSTWCGLKGLDTKKHQMEGIDWIMERELNPSLGPPGGFICDEMGLGKTIITIAAMVLHPEAPNQHTLIVLPKSLLEQWTDCIARFIGIEPLIYHGSNYKKITEEELKKSQIVITTYGMIATRKNKDQEEEYKSLLWFKKWNRIIYDEAHYLRNKDTSVFKGAENLKANIKWMVTGTPINNRPRDFYNQCIIQGVSECFTPKVDEIRAIIYDIVLKRTKKEVGIKLPNLIEKEIHVEWETQEEEKFVRNIHNLMSFTTVTAENVDSVIQNLGAMMGQSISILMLMKQSCVYPLLAQRALIKRAIDAGYDETPINQRLSYSKLSCVVNNIVKRKNSGKSKLVFCLFRDEMNALKSMLNQKGICSAIINGSTTKKQRKIILQSEINKETKKEPQVLLAQIQTCCEGLNLQQFSEIYFTNPHWNPAVEDQAIARAHRIGQTKTVEVFRFVTKFKNNKEEKSISLDEYCMEVQKKKRESAKKCGF